ncbi:MAG: acyl-CoA dehydrogenase family protein, partial [Xanthomonadales bacterium]|nr:acyl-CoA dehydrogenase family protein [Xanthomonadales bacterium]
MALVLNDEQLMLKESARDFLRERAPVSHLRKLRDEGVQEGFSRAVWGEMVDLGWSAILVPEAQGGLDYGFAGIGIVLEETGRTLTPSPLLATALIGVAAIRLAGSDAQCAAILPAVAGGQSLLALACDESPRHDPQQVASRAPVTPGGYSLSGRKIAVLDGHVADQFIVSARTDSGLGLFLVPANAAGVEVEAFAALDTHRAAELRFENVALEPGQHLAGTAAGDGQATLERILDAARIGAAAEMLGLAQEAFERTVGYLKARRQF